MTFLTSTPINFASMTVRQLRAMCRDLSISGYSKYVKLGKAALMQLHKQPYLS